MANVTYHDHTEKTSPVSADEIPIWSVADAAVRKTTRANLLGGVLTGGGTLATGGFTLTVPATGTAIVISTGTWSPVITGSTGNPTVTYTAQSGTYQRFGNLIIYAASITVNTFSDGTGVARFSLPLTVATTAMGVGWTSGVTLETDTMSLNFFPIAGAAYGNFTAVREGGGGGNIGVVAFAGSEVVYYSGVYWTS